METKHTPTPWKWTKRTNSVGSLAYSITGNHDSHGGWDEFENIAQIHGKHGGTNEANAAFIVRACGAHDELVHLAANWEIEEKEDGIWFVLHGNKIIGKAAFLLGDSGRDLLAHQLLRFLEADRREALAKARGEQC